MQLEHDRAQKVNERRHAKQTFLGGRRSAPSVEHLPVRNVSVAEGAVRGTRRWSDACSEEVEGDGAQC